MQVDRASLARAICIANGDDPEREGPFRTWMEESPYWMMAAASLAEITEQGFVIVPREPSEAMIRAVDVALHERWPNARLMAVAAYVAMILASLSASEQHHDKG